MLVLTRKVYESLTFTGGITVSVVSIGNGRVRLGIIAPPDVRVTRSELLTPETQPENYEHEITPAVRERRMGDGN